MPLGMRDGTRIVKGIGSSCRVNRLTLRSSLPIPHFVWCLLLQSMNDRCSTAPLLWESYRIPDPDGKNERY